MHKMNTEILFPQAGTPFAVPHSAPDLRDDEANSCAAAEFSVIPKP